MYFPSNIIISKIVTRFRLADYLDIDFIEFPKLFIKKKKTFSDVLTFKIDSRNQ